MVSEIVRFYKGDSSSPVRIKENFISKIVDTLKPVPESQGLIDYVPQLLNKHGHRKIEDLKILIPGKGVLNKIASYYREKYKIDIQICEYSFRSNNLKNILLGGSKGSAGIIMIEGESDYTGAHIYPLLVDFDKKKILVLDSVGAGSLGLFKPSFLSGIEGFTLNYAKECRQADTLSCWLESIIILRNALLCPLDWDSFPKSPSKIAKISDELTLPQEWTYIDQIGSQESSKVVPRNHFSKKTEKHDQTLSAFREKKSAPVTFSASIDLYDPELFQSKEPLSKTFEDGTTLTIETSPDKITFKLSEKKSVNLYLAYKGYQIAKRLGLITEDNIPPVVSNIMLI